MNSSLINTIHRMHEKRFSVRDIVAATGCKHSEVQRVLKGEPNPARKEISLTPTERAILELTAEGCDARVIEANFGRV